MDRMQAPPRGAFFGLLSDLASGTVGYMQDPRRTQQMQLYGQLLEGTRIPSLLEGLSYGDSMFEGSGVGTLRPNEDVRGLIELATTFAPAGKPAAAAAKAGTMALGRAGERMAERVVPQVMERGGLPAQFLTDLAQGSRSQIIPPDVARNIDMPVNLPQSPEFLRAVANEPSAQVTNEGLLMSLMRQQKPEQSGAESVRTGVFYLPEGQAKNMRHYRGPESTATYGGPEAIRGETMLKNPLFVKGATGGKAPEAAFDAVMGKGAMKQLDSDVLSVISERNMMTQKDPQAYVDRVRNLLSKYGANPNMAAQIIRNSGKGNQLRYALQENIIANAVRNAGHDAVLGYGKGRGDKGEFFSEVFDVRESMYPTPEGDFDLMPQFNLK
jgi:hypothetical protein